MIILKDVIAALEKSLEIHDDISYIDVVKNTTTVENLLSIEAKSKAKSLLLDYVHQNEFAFHHLIEANSNVLIDWLSKNINQLQLSSVQLDALMFLIPIGKENSNTELNYLSYQIRVNYLAGFPDVKEYSLKYIYKNKDYLKDFLNKYSKNNKDNLYSIVYILSHYPDFKNYSDVIIKIGLDNPFFNHVVTVGMENNPDLWVDILQTNAFYYFSNKETTNPPLQVRNHFKNRYRQFMNQLDQCKCIYQIFKLSVTQFPELYSFVENLEPQEVRINKLKFKVNFLNFMCGSKISNEEEDAFMDLSLNKDEIAVFAFLGLFNNNRGNNKKENNYIFDKLNWNENDIDFLLNTLKSVVTVIKNKDNLSSKIFQPLNFEIYNVLGSLTDTLGELKPSLLSELLIINQNLIPSENGYFYLKRLVDNPDTFNENIDNPLLEKYIGETNYSSLKVVDYYMNSNKSCVIPVWNYYCNTSMNSRVYLPYYEPYKNLVDLIQLIKEEPKNPFLLMYLMEKFCLDESKRAETDRICRQLLDKPLKKQYKNSENEMMDTPPSLKVFQALFGDEAVDTVITMGKGFSLLSTNNVMNPYLYGVQKWFDQKNPEFIPVTKECHDVLSF